MDSREFVRALRLAVRNPSIDGTLSAVANPTGRKIATERRELSEWFRTLSEVDRNYIRDIVSLSVDSALFGFLAVLDGAQAVENTTDKGRFELWYNGKQKRLLNSSEDAFLYEIYNDPDARPE